MRNVEKSAFGGKKILIATKNPGKLAEFRVLLKDIPAKLLSLKDLKIDYEVKEEGKTFQENAIKKAREYHKLCSLVTLAGDGGLEIETLNGEPGVNTHRWFGHPLADEEYIKAVLSKMKNVPEGKRKANMKIVLALAIPDIKQLKVFEGKIDFMIASKPYNKIIPGYPLRSLMFLPKEKKYFAEVSFEQQSQFSVIGKAVKKLKPYLKKILK